MAKVAVKLHGPIELSHDVDSREVWGLVLLDENDEALLAVTIPEDGELPAEAEVMSPREIVDLLAQIDGEDLMDVISGLSDAYNELYG